MIAKYFGVSEKSLLHEDIDERILAKEPPADYGYVTPQKARLVKEAMAIGLTPGEDELVDLLLRMIDTCRSRREDLER
jgi:hypothetical protein